MWPTLRVVPGARTLPVDIHEHAPALHGNLGFARYVVARGTLPLEFAHLFGRESRGRLQAEHTSVARVVKRVQMPPIAQPLGVLLSP